MSTAIHPLAPQHLPYFIASADGADPMFTNVAILLVVVVVIIGVFYLHLHSLPERLAHRQNSTQLQLIAVLAVLALFTHNNALWVLAILLAVVRPPDIVGPLNSIARSLRAMAGLPAPEATTTETTEASQRKANTVSDSNDDSTEAAQTAEPAQHNQSGASAAQQPDGAQNDGEQR